MEGKDEESCEKSIIILLAHKQVTRGQFSKKIGPQMDYSGKFEKYIYICFKYTYNKYLPYIQPNSFK